MSLLPRYAEYYNILFFFFLFIMAVCIEKHVRIATVHVNLKISLKNNVFSSLVFLIESKVLETLWSHYETQITPRTNEKIWIGSSIGTSFAKVVYWLKKRTQNMPWDCPNTKQTVIYRKCYQSIHDPIAKGLLSKHPQYF